MKYDAFASVEISCGHAKRNAQAYVLQIVLALIPFVGWILSLVLGLVYWALLIVNLIFSILGGVKVSNTGELYKYPVNIRWIK